MGICRLCFAEDQKCFVDFGMVPFARELVASPGAKSDFCSLTLHQCKRCGFIQSNDFMSPETLYPKYYSSWSSSWQPQPQIEKEITALKEFVSFDDAMLEAGCNDGNFLRVLRTAGFVHAQGIEPDIDAMNCGNKKGLLIHQGFFDRYTARQLVHAQGKFKCFIARNIFEHVPDMHGFLEAMQSILVRDGIVLLEVPDITLCVQKGDCSFVWEEHVNYFTEETIEKILNAHFFAVCKKMTFDYGGGTIAVVAKYTPEMGVAPDRKPDMDDFAFRVTNFGKQLRERLFLMKQAGYPILVYGASNRSGVVINCLGLGDLIDAIMEDQPEKQGLYTAGTFIPVVSLARYAIENSGRKTPICLLGVSQRAEAVVTRKLVNVFGEQIIAASLFEPEKLLAAL